MTERQIEALLTLETRRITMLDGVTRALTYTFLVWNAYDELLDAGILPETIVEYAEKPGWEPPNAPFEMRFSSVIADTLHRLRRQRRGSDHRSRS